MTLDFHNTLFHCDSWFQLEIADLPVAYLRWSSETRGVPASVDPDLEDAARLRYRQIRQEVMATGCECDAVASIRRVLDDLGIHSRGGNVKVGVDQIMRSSLNDARPLAGALALTRHLNQAGIVLAVISSAAYHPFLEWCLQRHGMRAAFSAVVTSASCGIYKSDPGIYRHTLGLLNADPGDAVHVGDSHRYDVISASMAGMKTIYLTNSDPKELAPKPDAVIRHLGEAKSHLVRLLPGKSLL